MNTRWMKLNDDSCVRLNLLNICYYFPDLETQILLTVDGRHVYLEYENRKKRDADIVRLDAFCADRTEGFK